MTIGEFHLPSWFLESVLFIIVCFLALGLYWAAEKILHIQLHGLLSIIKSEWEDSKAGRRTVGAYNWKGFIALMIFGFVAMIFTSSQKLIGLAAAAIGLEKAAELAKSTDFFTLVYALALWLLGSLLCVIADNKVRSSRK